MIISHFFIVILLSFNSTANADVSSTNLSQDTEKEDTIEGDILMDHQLRRVIHTTLKQKQLKNFRRHKRDAIKYKQKKWENAIVPYIFDGSLRYSTRNIVLLAMQEFHDNTCVWFIPRKNETDFIRIIHGTGCYSKIGRQGGEQIISLGPGCNHKSTAMHELMHAIGFFHENSRYDRDYFVKILWWNIKQGAEKNFLTYSHGKLDTFHMPYDIHSLMHYDRKAFTKNYGDTIQALENPDAFLGGTTFSKIDIKQILLLYNCGEPVYRIRRELCKDRHKIGCMAFMAYPEYCNVHARYTMEFCRRTCRKCEVTPNWHDLHKKQIALLMKDEAFSLNEG